MFMIKRACPFPATKGNLSHEPQKIHQNFTSMILSQGLELTEVCSEGLLYQVSILYFRDGPKDRLKFAHPNSY